MTDYIGMGSRILFTLRAVNSTMAKFLLHNSACSVTTGLGFNSRLASPIQNIVKIIILSRKFFNSTCMKVSSCEPPKGGCHNKLGDTRSSLDRDEK
jgi:hypothetical protein